MCLKVDEEFDWQPAGNEEASSDGDYNPSKKKRKIDRGNVSSKKVNVRMYQSS